MPHAFELAGSRAYREFGRVRPDGRGGAPEPNAVVHGDEVDLWFPKLAVAVEVRSELHDNPTARQDDMAKKERLERRGVRVLWIS